MDTFGNKHTPFFTETLWWLSDVFQLSATCQQLEVHCKDQGHRCLFISLSVFQWFAWKQCIVIVILWGVFRHTKRWTTRCSSSCTNFFSSDCRTGFKYYRKIMTSYSGLVNGSSLLYNQTFSFWFVLQVVFLAEIKLALIFSSSASSLTSDRTVANPLSEQKFTRKSFRLLADA